MKTKTILLIIFSLCGIMPCASQEQESVFPTSDAIWSIQLYVNDQYVTEYRYGLFGDTIIDSKQYNKLYLLNDTLLHIDENDIYIGGFRQEDKKVYFLKSYDYEKEYVLYDFGKEVGESITWLDLPYYYGDWVEMDGFPAIAGIFDWEITREILDIKESDYGRIFHLSPTYLYSIVNSNWIEGVGSTAGLFWDFITYAMCYNSCYYKLSCMKLGDEWFYLDDNCDSCFNLEEGSWPNSLSNIDAESCFVFSNQLTKQIEIHATFLLGDCVFELLNLQGQVIQTEKLNSAHHFFSYVGKQGVFLYRIVENGRVIQTGKLVL